MDITSDEAAISFMPSLVPYVKLVVAWLGLRIIMVDLNAMQVQLEENYNYDFMDFQPFCYQTSAIIHVEGYISMEGNPIDVYDISYLP